MSIVNAILSMVLTDVFGVDLNIFAIAIYEGISSLLSPFPFSRIIHTSAILVNKAIEAA